MWFIKKKMRRTAPQTLGRATHHCRKAADDINAFPAGGSKQEYPSAEGESPALKQAPKSSGSVPGAVIAQSAKVPALQLAAQLPEHSTGDMMDATVNDSLHQRTRPWLYSDLPKHTRTF